MMVKSAARTLCAIVTLGSTMPTTAQAFLPEPFGPFCDSIDYTIREKRSVFDLAQQFYGRIVGFDNHLDAHAHAKGLPGFLRTDRNDLAGRFYFDNDGYPAQLAIVEHYAEEIARLNKIGVSTVVERGTVLKLPYGGRIECGKSGKIRRE